MDDWVGVRLLVVVKGRSKWLSCQMQKDQVEGRSGNQVGNGRKIGKVKEMDPSENLECKFIFAG